MACSKSKKIISLILTTAVIFISACSDSGNDQSQFNENDSNTIRIGFLMDTLKEERWQRDRDFFVARAKELGAEVIVQNGNNDSEEQVNQLKFLLEQDIDILVVVPHDAEKASYLVQMAKREGKKVISYDRLVRNAGVDLYISFDAVKVGALMAENVLKVAPEGNYLVINGAKTDFNSFMYNEGVKKVLDAPIKNGSINIIGETWAEDWKPEEAFKFVESTLQEGKKLDAVIAANDSLAGAVIEALAERRLAGKIPVSGHDADLAGCQRVVEGTQLMTVYKPIDKLAMMAAETAIKMAKGEEIDVEDEIYDGRQNVPQYVIQPIAVTKETIGDTVIQEGFHKLEDVYKFVPKSQWPEN